MKRGDLYVGMAVEDKKGTGYVVVDIGGWRNWGGYRLNDTGVVYDDIPVWSAASSVTDADGRVGVLVVGQHWLTRIENEADPVVGNILRGEPLQAQRMYPAGTYQQRIKDRKDAMEARVEADAKRDRELVEQVNLYWGDVPHLIATCGVHLDGGLLTDREVQTLVTMILCGQNRNL